MGGGGEAVTVKLTVKFAEMPLAPLTVTVAVHTVPTSNPVLGTTVKPAVPFTAMLFIDGVLNVKEPLLLPESAAVNAPVG
jgi:hypothetical protein